MSLSLSRWEDHQGSTAGWWLIREIPGLVITRTPGGDWSLQLLARTPKAVGLDDMSGWPLHDTPLQLWGPDYQVDMARSLVHHTPALQRVFATRAEALEALTLAIEGPAPEPVLATKLLID